MINTEKLDNTISKFRMLIGMIPSNYKTSLSYEEQLFEIGNYIENTLVPALNTDIEAIQELQNLFIELQNYVNNYFENLDIQNSVDIKINNLINNGTISNLINEKIFRDVNNHIVENSLNISKNSNEIKNKVSKNENNSITMDMLSQEIKESMTGGSVAVVEQDSIDNINIKNNAIDILNLNEMLSDNYLKNYKLLDYKNTKTNGFYIKVNNKLQLRSETDTYYSNYKVPLEKGKIYFFNGFNTDYKGIYIVDNELNVKMESPNIENIGGSYYRTSLLFRCNEDNLTAIMNTQKTITISSVNYTLLTELSGLYELENVNNLLFDFPQIFTQDIEEIKTILGSYFWYSNPYATRGTDTSEIHLYPMNKGITYIIDCVNDYEMAGVAIFDKNLKISYISSTAYTSHNVPVHYEFTAVEDGYIAIARNSNTPYSCKKYVPFSSENNINLLKNKQLSCIGDSICQNFGGYATQIKNITQCNVQNLAVGGATIAKVENKNCIAEQVQSISNPDLILVEGSINDYWVHVNLGEFSNTDYTEELDLTTFSGGLESIFRYCYNNFPEIPVFFIVQHKIKNTAFRKNNRNLTYEDYYNRILELCKKYCIQVIDIYKNVNFNTELENISQNYTTNNDGTHPTVEAYQKFYVNYIINKLYEKLF